MVTGLWQKKWFTTNQQAHFPNLSTGIIQILEKLWRCEDFACVNDIIQIKLKFKMMNYRVSPVSVKANTSVVTKMLSLSAIPI